MQHSQYTGTYVRWTQADLLEIMAKLMALAAEEIAASENNGQETAHETLH